MSTNNDNGFEQWKRDFMLSALSAVAVGLIFFYYV